MAERYLGKAVRQMLRSLASDSGDNDFCLLDRFAQFGDEEAFEILLERHGPMVWRTCLRVVRQPADAEDAFQATFLVLCRKARAIGRRESLAGWLYQVAYRIALKAKRRVEFEALESCHLLTQEADPSAALAQADLRSVLDESLLRLPVKYRVPLVLCCLEGRTLKRTAAELGWAEGTLSSRLARGKELLRTQLLRRNATLSAAGLATLLAREGSAGAVPWSVAQATLKAKAWFLLGEVGGTAGTGGLAAKAVSLAEGAMKAMLLTKIKVAAVVVLAVSVLGVGSGVVMNGVFARRHAVLEEAEQAKPVAKAEERRAEGGERRAVRTDRYGDPLPEGALARLGTVRLRREDGAAYTFAFTPNGRELISARTKNIVQSWDAETGKPLAEFRHERAFDLFTTSQNGETFATAGFFSGTIIIWDKQTKSILRKIAVKGRVDSIALAADGKMLASAGEDSVIRLWDVATGVQKRQLAGHTSTVHSLLFARDGRKLISGDEREIRVWELSSGLETRKIGAESEIVKCLSVSADGAVMASGRTEYVNNAAQAKLSLWDVATGNEQRQLQGHKHVIHTVAFSPDGKTLASAENETIHLWDTTSGKELRRIEKTGWHKYCLVFSPDGKTLASTAPGNETVIRLWNVATGKQLQPVAPDGIVRTVAFSPDGRVVATGSWLGNDRSLRLWDAATGMPLWESAQEPRFYINKVIFTPDGKGVVSSGTDRVLRLWDARTGGQIRTYPIPEAQGPVVEMAISSEGKMLTSLISAPIHEEKLGVPEDQTGLVIVWDVQTAKRLLVRRGKEATFANILPFSPDGCICAERKDRSAAPSDRRKVLCLREVATGRQLLSLEPSNVQPGEFLEEAVAFTSDNRTVAAITNRMGTISTVHLWDLASGQPRPGLRISGGMNELKAVAFSPDGRTLAAVGKGVVLLWDVGTGKELLAEHGQETKVFPGALAFSPDGKRLVTGYMDSTAVVWDLTPGIQRATALRSGVTRSDLGRLWADLADDPAKAHTAIWMLAAMPEKTLPLLKGYLTPAKEVDSQRIRQLLLDLDGTDFAVRQAASKELKQLDDQALPLLREALATKPSLETRRRIEELISQPEIVQPPESLRRLRAVHVLEQVGTLQARDLLTMLAAGAPGARLTQEAKASLDRLAKRPAARP